MIVRHGDRGSVTAEFAVVVPAVVLVVLLTAATLTGAARQVRLEQAVAQAARLAARGESDARVQAVAAALGGKISLGQDGDLVCATASAPSAVPLPLPPLRASSCALSGGR